MALGLLVGVAMAVPTQTGTNPHGDLELECSACHGTEGWDRLLPVLQFDHNTDTSYPLEGFHREVACALCHTNLIFLDVATTCAVCHTDIHRGEFGQACEECHSPQGWLDEAGFRLMHQETRFPLVGVHAPLDCQACHSSGQYRDLSTTCQTCHWDSYQATTNPNHVQAGFDADCSLCHGVQRWDESIFDHARTGFPLVGQHATLACVECHSGGNYAIGSSACYACHQADFEGTTDPNHVAEQYPTDCVLCHTALGWDRIVFDHNDTGFPLTGAHRPLDCLQCHQNGYSGTPTECYACHQADFEGTTDPDHVQQNFPTDCALCHSTANWDDADFDHSQTDFPLTGAHVGLDCSLCHTAGYVNTPSDCFFCHEAEYNNTTDPNHAAAGFPQDCESCHSTVNWDDANFNHDAQWFPIYSGEHRNEWASCSECHPNASNYQVFTCISCHEHSQSEMNGEHDDVRGYVYDSAACYDCHPDGRAEDDHLLHPTRIDSPKER